MSMKKQKWLRITNPVLGLVLLIQAGTGLLHDRIPYEVFEILHPWAGIVLLLLACLHLFFNWDWVRLNYFKKKKAA